MYLGEQLATLADARLALAAQLGVARVALHTTGRTEAQRAIAGPDGRWDVAAIHALRQRLARHGITVEVLSLDVEALWWALLREEAGIGPAGEAAALLAVAQENIRAAGRAGVPCLKYRIQPIGVLRTGRVPGRGGARYAAFDAAAWTDHSLTEVGQVSAERMWAVVERLVTAMVPVAETAGVRLACHPQDPALPPVGLRGIPHVLDSVDALRRFLALADSPVHGLNFCQGTVAEMCDDPAAEVPAAIRTLGATGRLFMVHFRNITGGRLRFEEVYPDNGAVDMLAAMRAYKEVGYRGMFCPDHVPYSDVDPHGERQFAYCLGYTRALLQAVGA